MRISGGTWNINNKIGLQPTNGRCNVVESSIMFETIDYSFYRIAVFFQNLSVVWLINAISILSIIQSFNVFFICNILTLFTDKFIEFDLLLTFIAILFFVLINSIRYLLIKKFEFLDRKWKHESDCKKKKKGLILIIYLIISPILYIVSAH